MLMAGLLRYARAVFIEPKAMTVIGFADINKLRGAKRRSNPDEAIRNNLILTLI